MDRFQIIRGEEPPPNEFLEECDRDAEFLKAIESVEVLKLKYPSSIKTLADDWRRFSNNWDNK